MPVSERAGKTPSLIGELKRRNVFRVAVAYVVMSWLVVQVADIAVPALRLPDWVTTLILLLLGLGFLPTLVFAWAFELTPEGIKREKDVKRGESITHDTGRKLNTVTLVALGLVIGVVALDRFYVHDHESPAAVLVADDEVSIAVLPFADMSPAGDQEYFSDGITEEILNGLAQLRAMKVAGRTSSFAFKGRNEDLREIGAALGVQNVLEGSVRKDGNRLRITAQLVKVSDGFHLWSDTYDRELEDVFAVQDEISAAIVKALQGSLLGDSADRGERRDVDIGIYEKYLEARKLIWNRNNEDLLAARELLEEIVAAAPDFPPGLISLAETVLLLRGDSFFSYGDLDPDEAKRIATPLLERAIELDPTLADAYAVRGLMLNGNLEFDAARESLLKAVELNPSLTNAWLWLGNNAAYRQKFNLAMEYLQTAAEIDPLWLVPNGNLIRGYEAFGRVDDAQKIVERLRPFHEESATFHAIDGEFRQAVGDLADAERALRRAYELSPDTPSISNRYALILVNLQAYEEAIRIVPPQLAPLEYFVTGRWDAALPRLRAEIDRGPGNLILYFIYTAGANYAGDFEGVAGLYDAHVRSPQFFGERDVADLAYGFTMAMERLGREADKKALLDFLAGSLERRETQGENNGDYFSDLASYQALTGDFDAALESLQLAFDKGVRFGFGWHYSPEFEPVIDDPRMIALTERNLEAINAERLKLGWDPVPEVGTFIDIEDEAREISEPPRPVH